MEHFGYANPSIFYLDYRRDNVGKLPFALQNLLLDLNDAALVIVIYLPLICWYILCINGQL